MSKPLRVLFVTERWCVPERMLSSSYHHLFSAFASTGFGIYRNFFFDECALEQVGSSLLYTVETWGPDLILFTPLPGSAYNPGEQILARIANGKPPFSKPTPIAIVLWDGVHPDILAMADQLEPFCAGIFVCDCNTFKRNNKYVPIWSPQDPNLMTDPGFERKIQLSFCGWAYPGRQAYINGLRDRGIAVYQTGGERQMGLSPREYAAVYQESMLTLNFSRTASGLDQNKGRLWEAMLCGACVLEQENSETPFWFEPGVDYVSFDSVDYLAAAIKDLLANPSKAALIAANGARKCRERYTAKHWWEIVLKKCLGHRAATGATCLPKFSTLQES